jgi:cell fate (sporulation/competence/biofilm development) regulator YmcA (YheA/YmcA/DUF963 family)
MAGDWLKFEKSTLEKPEVLEMAGMLDLDTDAVIGKLLRVWNWFDDHTIDGNAPVTVRALLDRYTGVTGFVTTMEKVGWVIESNDRLILPNFDRHNGASSKKRALGNNRKANWAANQLAGNAKSNAKSNALSVTKALPEKRREEKSRVLSKDNTSDAEMIYSAYPKKVGKQQAMKAIAQSLKQIPACELLPIVQQYAKARDGADQQYTPNPATWFNQGRWMDDPETWKPKQPTGTFGVKNPTTHNERHPDQLNEDLLSELAKVTTTYH